MAKVCKYCKPSYRDSYVGNRCPRTDCTVAELTEIDDWYKAHRTTMILHKNTKILYEDILKKYLAAVKEVEKNGEA